MMTPDPAHLYFTYREVCGVLRDEQKGAPSHWRGLTKQARLKATGNDLLLEDQPEFHPKN